MSAPAIVWLRQDLRLSDNPALHAAHQSKRPLIVLYIHDNETPNQWRLGGASRWWLHQSLEALGKDIAKRGGALVLRHGRADVVLPKLIRETSAGAVYWNRCYEPYAIKRDTALKERLVREGIEVHSTNAALLVEPWTITTKTGEPYKVFTPFWRACLQAGIGRPLLPAPKALSRPSNAILSHELTAWRLRPTKPNWAKGFEASWTPGEAGARSAMSAFIGNCLRTYPEGRDQLGANATSHLSPHLHFGEISPAQIAAAIDAAAEDNPSLRQGAEKFMTEIGWREFSANLLFHWPSLPERNWRKAFDAFAWRDDDAALDAWRRGRTGYPIVDAGMRELWITGYMHNRARMIAASFLIKHLLIDWRAGQDWFWDTLVDADLANNAASWQWVAGSGADASPYFRIFNPITQGMRFDSDGAYVRRWIPELSKLPSAFIHKPWEADVPTLKAAGVSLGDTYPERIIEHGFARQRALDAFARLPKA